MLQEMERLEIRKTCHRAREVPERVDRNSLRERQLRGAVRCPTSAGGIVAGLAMEQDRQGPAEQAAGRDRIQTAWTFFAEFENSQTPGRPTGGSEMK